MNGNVVQSTLRQLQAKGRSRSLWSTFVAIAVLFIVTGPYGTGQKMAFWPRAAYWTLLLGSGWIITTGFSAFANAALVRTLTSPLARMMAGAIAAALLKDLGVTVPPELIKLGEELFEFGCQVFG